MSTSVARGAGGGPRGLPADGRRRARHRLGGQHQRPRRRPPLRRQRRRASATTSSARTTIPSSTAGTGRGTARGAPTSEIALHTGLMARDARRRRRRAHPLAVRRGVLRRPPRPAVHLQREHRHPRRAGARHRRTRRPVRRTSASRRSRTLSAQPGSRAVLLANHGVVAIGPDLDDAYVVAQSVEWTAEICHLARTLVAAGAGEHVLDRRGAGGDRPQLRRDDRSARRARCTLG